MSLRVCLVSAAYHPYPSGVSEHVYNLALALKESGHQVEVLTTRFPERQATADPFPVTRLGRAILLPMNRSYATLPVGIRLPWQVGRFFRERRFDLIHCHGVFPPEISYWALRRTRLPAVVTFHTLGSLPAEPILKAFRALSAGLNRRIGAKVAVSQAGADFARRLFPGEYDVIPNGVDTRRFHPGAEVPALLHETRLSILYVGRLEHRKGLPVLLHAMPRVLASVPDARLVAVGTGPLERHCRDIVRRLDLDRVVHFAGRVPASELPGFYAGCTVYASPALGGEAMGIVLIEALACGKPVVASMIPGYDEVLRNGRDGILVPPNDPGALADAIVRLLGSPDLRDGLSRNALARAREFTWPTVARRVESVYRRLVPDRASPVRPAGGQTPKPAFRNRPA